METLGDLINSWPLVGLVLGTLALFLFRRPLVQLLSRIHEVHVPGVKVSAGAQKQMQEEAPSGLSALEELIKSLQNPLITQVERELLQSIDDLSLKAEERERFLIKHLAAQQIALFFEKTYHAIFGSQLAVLHFLASLPDGLADPDDLRPLYDDARHKYPEYYSSFTFESWRQFLLSQVLIAEHDGKVGITVRGKELLKYLVDCNYTSDKSL